MIYFGLLPVPILLTPSFFGVPSQKDTSNTSFVSDSFKRQLYIYI